MDTTLTITEFSIRLLVAAGAGFFIGLERQWHRKSAGLPTNTLVAIEFKNAQNFILPTL